MAFTPLPFLRLSPAIIAAFLASVLILLAPALWNGFPILFYDSGDYYLRYIDGILNNGRSIAYGALIGGLRYPNFWPVAAIQCALTVWTIYLLLRTHGLARRSGALPLALLTVIAALSALTALAWIAGMLMPDLFAALGVLGIYLLIMKREALLRVERYALAGLIAFSAAIHNATLAVILALITAAIALHLWHKPLIARAGLRQAAFAILVAGLLVPTAGLVFAGKFAWTPGGAGFVFSRLVQDGIAQRYLAENCPNPSLKLCEVRHALPNTADDFLWHQGDKGPFAHIGGFEGGADEMRRITIDSLVQYPWMHVKTAIATTAKQLVSVRTGDQIDPYPKMGFTYGVLRDNEPSMQPAMQASLQWRDKLKATFVKLNYVHEPLTLAAMASLPFLLMLAWRRGTMRDTDWLAGTVILALLANAFVTGALSNPHDRYGARLAWTAPLTWSVIFVQFAVTTDAWRTALMRMLAESVLARRLVRRMVPARARRR